MRNLLMYWYQYDEHALTFIRLKISLEGSPITSNLEASCGEKLGGRETLLYRLFKSFEY